MEFQKLPLNSRALLGEIVSAENPTDLLCDKFKKASPQQDRELRGILRELGERNYLKIQWADNKPHHVTINNSAEHMRNNWPNMKLRPMHLGRRV